MIPQISLSDGVPVLMFPFSFIVFISAVKDLLEDTKRKRSDNEENTKPIMVYRNNKLVQSQWKSLRIGEIVKVIIKSLTASCKLLADSRR